MEEKDGSPSPLSLEKGNEKVPPIVYGATGYTGLVTLGGKIFDECASDLIWPKALLQDQVPQERLQVLGLRFECTRVVVYETDKKTPYLIRLS